ncbi:hypothetical protein N6Q81_21545, partial [Streptomyces vinaceusdrappus]
MTRTPATEPITVPPESGLWDDLVTSALLGTDRRTPQVSAHGSHAPAAQPDARAAETVRRRAVLRPAP